MTKIPNYYALMYTTKKNDIISLGAKTFICLDNCYDENLNICLTLIDKTGKIYVIKEIREFAALNR